MSKFLIITSIVCFLLLNWLNFDNKDTREKKLLDQINFQIHSGLQYKPKGFIFCSRIPGGLNNQLEQLWFLNILAQRTQRVLVEKELKLIDSNFGTKVNLTELINRPKYLSNLATVPEKEYLKYCGPYAKTINLQNMDWTDNDELEFMIQKVNSLLDHTCITIRHFPSYDFFERSRFTDWVPDFKKLILPNFEFSSLIKEQADYFIKENNLKDGNFISVQFRRGDFKEHCKYLFQAGVYNWAFGLLYENKFSYPKNDWAEFELHCYPSVGTLVMQLINFTSNLTIPVTKVVALTNANQKEVEDLKSMLNTKKMELLRFTPNQELVPNSVKWTITHSLAVEMELAIRGHYLMGNRHSSINSNLIALRLNNGLDSNIFV